jgi:hypothetical protein
MRYRVHLPWIKGVESIEGEKDEDGGMGIGTS